MNRNLNYVATLVILYCSFAAKAQLAERVENGMIYINDGSFRQNPKKYVSLADSLDRNIKANSRDTTSMFFRSLLYLSFNSLIAKPSPSDKGALDNLIIAKDLVEKAASLKMKSFNLKILRAQIYKELTYRFAGDESWMYNTKQIAVRRRQFDIYKEMANKYYDELSILDKQNTYDYEKLKVKTNYPF